MKNNKPDKASTATPSNSNVCGTGTGAKGKAAADANKLCKEKIESSREALKTPGAEAA